MNWTVSHNDITDHIINLEQSFLSPIVACSKIISYLKELLWSYREHVCVKDFKSIDEEIHFFKSTKTHPLSYLVQYKKQLEFEIENKNHTSSNSSETIQNEINNAQKFITKHHAFMIYMEIGRTDFDELYFLRKNNNKSDLPSSTIYNYDRVFCTSYDCLWAEIIGTNNFIKFLNTKLHSQKNPYSRKLNSFNVNWTGSKVALTELAIALKYSGSLNNGNISFKDTILFLQKLFNKDLGEFNHTAMRLKNRSHPTKFIDVLKSSLEGWIEKSDSANI
jgi:hypothetical protein